MGGMSEMNEMSNYNNNNNKEKQKSNHPTTTNTTTDNKFSLGLLEYSALCNVHITERQRRERERERKRARKITKCAPANVRSMRNLEACHRTASAIANLRPLQWHCQELSAGRHSLSRSRLVRAKLFPWSVFQRVRSVATGTDPWRASFNWWSWFNDKFPEMSKRICNHIAAVRPNKLSSAKEKPLNAVQLLRAGCFPSGFSINFLFSCSFFILTHFRRGGGRLLLSRISSVRSDCKRAKRHEKHWNGQFWQTTQTPIQRNC